MTPNSDDLMTFALELARAAGREIAPFFRSRLDVDNKAKEHWDPVTEGDRAAERAIRALIERHYPEHGIIGEEYGEKAPRSEFTWVLDPIDGTRAFVIGMPTWTTLVGLYRNDQPYLGVMVQPFVGDYFFGGPDGAWLEQGGTRRPLRVSQTRELSKALVGTTSPHTYRDPASQAGLARVDKACRALRYGGDAYFFSLVAAGLLDIAMDAGVQIYDIAALIPIIKGAGGHVAEWTGGDPSRGGNFIAAATPDLLHEAVNCFKS